MRSFILVVCSILVFSCRYLSVLGDEVSDGETDPCKTGRYHELSEQDRAAGFEILDKPKSDKDDLNDDTAWYRFTGEAGTRMATHCVPEKHCGTEVTGWLNGSRPSKEEGIVNRTVCFHSEGDCCFWKKEVKVRNCGGFFLYHLRRDLPEVNKNYRYCGNGEAPDPCDKRFYKVLKDADRAVGFVTTRPAKCDHASPAKCNHASPAKCNHTSPAECNHTSPAKCNHASPAKCAPASPAKCNHKSPDKLTNNGWYRFSGSAGVAMPTECVDTMRCGAERVPGWLLGGHPRAAEGVVIRSVCFHWRHKCCYYKTDIQVKNCRGFFVYKFKRLPANNLRYCGNGAKNETGPVKPLSSEVCKNKSKVKQDNPCLSGEYITLSEPDRAAGFLTTGHAECDRTDFNDEEAWYRFTGKAGTGMAKKCVPVRRCGTNAPGWLNGTHPEGEDEGAVTRTVCFNWKNDCCHWRTKVKVRRCGGFYLYYLKRDPWGGCSYRYCGNGNGPTETPTTQVTGATRQTQGPQGNPGMTTPISRKIPPRHEEINVTCGKNKMSISIPKKLLKGLERKHLRLTDLDCGATETQTHYILTTNLTKCHTKRRHTKDFVCYMNKVEEIPVRPDQIITRVREVEIPFSCYYSNMGVVSAVGLEVKSKKIVFSKKERGEFVLAMTMFPNNKFLDHYKKKDFPVHLPLRKELFVEVSVDTEDSRLAILAEECFATPDPNPDKAGLVNYTFIEDGCAIDNTVKSIQTADQRSQRFSIQAFKFIGEHQFVYMHCKLVVCNRTDPNSRCAQGCLHNRLRRSLKTQETNDEEYYLAQGPFIRKEEDTKETNLQEINEGLGSMDIKDQKSSPWMVTSATVTGAICLMGMSYIMWSKKARPRDRGYVPIAQ